MEKAAFGKQAFSIALKLHLGKARQTSGPDMHRADKDSLSRGCVSLSLSCRAVAAIAVITHRGAADDLTLLRRLSFAVVVVASPLSFASAAIDF